MARNLANIAVLAFALCAVPGSATARGGTRGGKGGTIRDYYVQLDLVEWDYAPSGLDLIKGQNLTTEGSASAVFTEDTGEHIGRKYMKSLYFQYTDATYTERVPQPGWNGNNGPIIRAEVGDTLHVYFKNNLPAGSPPSSMHAHGVFYTPESEGAFWDQNQNPGSKVEPGESFMYEWIVRESSGPTQSQGNANLWAYHGHVDSAPDIYSGQVGPLIIYKKGTLDRRTNLPTDVDKEFVITFMVSDENQSHFLNLNIETYGGNPDDPDFEESNLMHSMNGFVFGNLPGLDMNKDDNVRWHIIAYGTEIDLHTAHWHGNNVVYDDKNIDTLDFLPSMFRTAIMTPDDPGPWLFHCHVNDHQVAGMEAFYNVYEKGVFEPAA